MTRPLAVYLHEGWRVGVLLKAFAGTERADAPGARGIARDANIFLTNRSICCIIASLISRHKVVVSGIKTCKGKDQQWVTYLSLMKWMRGRKNS